MLEHVIAREAGRSHGARDPEEIRTLILKLRWMGMEDEAEELAGHLARVAPSVTLTDVMVTD